MSAKLKLYLGRKVIESLKNRQNLISPSQLKSSLQVGTPSSDENGIELGLPINVVENQLGVSSVNDILKIQHDDIIQSVQYVKERANSKISFKINRNRFVKDIIENSSVYQFDIEPRKVVVEYSSPNVAKPFHFGHLRSTIIGNFVSNLYSYLNYDVTRLNYLGDWGTQLGLIQVGVEKLNYSNEIIKNNPIKLLYGSYVHANKLAEMNPDVAKLAREKFKNLERGQSKDLEQWKTFLAYTIDELKSIYARLGMTFDEYNYESMYSAKDIQGVVDILKRRNILQMQPDGKQVAMVKNRAVSLIKSDGSTLYLTRDIAAAIDRFNKYNFDKMYYIVENGQNDHFNSLKDILYKMNFAWADRIKHVKFGRIHGMSTRKGTSVFLRDILDEMKQLMILKQIKSPTTKVSITDDETSDILGVSCVIASDLKQRRQKDYQFSWDKVLEVQGDSGIKLQYTHSRLCSLETNCGVAPAEECNPKLIENPEVTTLIREIARFPDVLQSSHDQLEACVLVNYLFRLCNHISRTLKILRVKGEAPDVAAQRLLVFKSAKAVLGEGMRILGIRPLTKM